MAFNYPRHRIGFFLGSIRCVVDGRMDFCPNTEYWSWDEDPNPLGSQVTATGLRPVIVLSSSVGVSEAGEGEWQLSL